MTKNHHRLLEILRQHAIDGWLHTDEDEVRGWIGDDAKSWNIQLMINELNDNGLFKSYLPHSLGEKASLLDIELPS